MSKSKHTPGPWETGEDHGDDRPVSVYADGQNVLIADVFPDDTGAAARDENARLIRLAPRMLAVLDRLWAAKDAAPGDEVATRELYNAWLDLRDVRNEAHGN